jgi:hypothetical protein
VFVLLYGILVCLAAQPVEAAELRKETAAPFEHYVGASEKRIKSELHNGPFLFINELPETRRVEAYSQLREGKILVKQVNAKEEGHPIEVPHGLIHDWIGVEFIPNASLSQTLLVIQDYDNHRNIYKSEVRDSKLLQRDGNNFKVFLQFYKKSLVTVVINGDFDINYEDFRSNRAVIRSYSTRLVEVENAGQTDEREMPVDDAHGYLWRLYSYWRFEEKDGGRLRAARIDRAELLSARHFRLAGKPPAARHPAWNPFEPAQRYTCCRRQIGRTSESSLFSERQACLKWVAGCSQNSPLP